MREVALLCGSPAAHLRSGPEEGREVLEDLGRVSYLSFRKSHRDGELQSPLCPDTRTDDLKCESVVGRAPTRGTRTGSRASPEKGSKEGKIFGICVAVVVWASAAGVPSLVSYVCGVYDTHVCDVSPVGGVRVMCTCCGTCVHGVQSDLRASVLPSGHHFRSD